MSQAASLVSVIIIFRDPGAFIEEAIDSVFAQTHRAWELLLVDDGSTDESSGIARRFAAAYPAQVRYLEHPGHENRGMSASRNLGIAEARGDFIAFLDADDVFLPRRLERHLEVLNAALDVAMVYGPTLYWYGWTGRPEDVSRDFIGNLHAEDGTRFDPPELLRRFLRSGGAALPGICSLLARREAVRHIGGFEESFRGAFEDQVFLSKMALHAPILVVKECLDKYRQHNASYSAQAVSAAHYHPKRANPARRTFLDWLEAYLRARQVRDPLVWRWLDREFRPYRQPRLHAVLAAPSAIAGALKFAAKRAVRLVRAR
jgi:glycosyltransferase involved in cell wall biosynthesis